MSVVDLAAEGIGIQGGASDGCIPLFEMQAVPDKQATAAEGRPIFREVPFVSILIPGERDTVIRRVRDADKDRWPRQWAQFETKRTQISDGTPIEQWPLLNVSQVAELRALNIMTVEALASLSDGLLDRVGPGAVTLRKKAQRFLEYAKDSAAHDAPFAEVDSLRTQVEDMRKELAELRAENKVLAANQRKRPGRPRKETESDDPSDDL